MSRDYITQAIIKNYRSLADVTVSTPPLTVLVGANGSGKSNFVDAFRFVSEALQLGLDAAVTNRGGIGRIRRWSAKGRPYDVSITLNLSLDNQGAEYTFTLSSEKRNEYRIKREYYRYGPTVFLERENNQWVVEPRGLSLPVQERGLTLPLLSNTAEIKPIYDFLTNMGFYTIFPNVLRPPQKPTNPYPLDEHGENLASALREFLATSDWSNDLRTQLESVISGATNLRVTQVGSYLVVRLKHKDGSEFDLEQESDGTLRVLGILLALYQQPPRTLTAIEEPELTIHPSALPVLCEVIKETSQRSQVIITTHSPDLIASFDVDALRVVERTEDGTQIGVVDNMQRQVIEEQLFKASDLLRIDGGLRRAHLEE
jgi:predicted ATPase